MMTMRKRIRRGMENCLNGLVALFFFSNTQLMARWMDEMTEIKKS